MAEAGVVVLQNGVRVPQLGLGLSHNGGFSADAVREALRLGVSRASPRRRRPLPPH